MANFPFSYEAKMYLNSARFIWVFIHIQQFDFLQGLMRDIFLHSKSAMQY